MAALTLLDFFNEDLNGVTGVQPLAINADAVEALLMARPGEEVSASPVRGLHDDGHAMQDRWRICIKLRDGHVFAVHAGEDDGHDAGFLEVHELFDDLLVTLPAALRSTRLSATLQVRFEEDGVKITTRRHPGSSSNDEGDK